MIWLHPFRDSGTLRIALLTLAPERFPVHRTSPQGVIVEGVNHFSLLEHAVTGGMPLNRSIHVLIRG